MFFEIKTVSANQPPFQVLEPLEQSDALVTLAAIVGVILSFILIVVINKFFSGLYMTVENWCFTHLRVIRIFSLELMLPGRLIRAFAKTTRRLRSVIVLIILLTGLILTLSVIPETRWIPAGIFEQATDFSVVLWQALINFVPKLLSLILIVVVTHYTLKLLRFFLDGIKQEKIKISGFHPDLIDPTFQLLRFFVVVFALVAAYPYIPGSDSPVFRGLSIFIGFLLSLGSTTLVSNIISGIILTYTRGMRKGDRVQIGNAIGDVVDRNLLVTRIRTIKNVVITIPNGMVMNDHIINYSSSASKQGLILNTTVTIGYDVPWRQVQALLIEAALSTPGVLKEPRPFVLQTSLDDCYVSYELNAYTRDPSWMAKIYSNLHQNIQDQFTEAQVEILSPLYAAYRSGSNSTIPDPQSVEYLPRIFRSPSEEDTRPYPDNNGRK